MGRRGGSDPHPDLVCACNCSELSVCPWKEQRDTAAMLADFIDCPPDDEKAPPASEPDS